MKGKSFLDQKVFAIIFKGLSLKRIKPTFFGRLESDFQFNLLLEKYLKHIAIVTISTENVQKMLLILGYMFSCEFCNIFRTTFLRNTSGRLLVAL